VQAKNDELRGLKQSLSKYEGTSNDDDIE